jgi:predicted AAA+ superfamily ATPase
MQKTQRRRYLSESIEKDLERGSVFLSGPRQVGKATLGLAILGVRASDQHPSYLNWDRSEDRRRIQRVEIPMDEPVVLDELHKFTRRQTWLDGLNQEQTNAQNWLMTGSAHLGTNTSNSTSYRLHPFSLGELDPDYTQTTVRRLFELGGFPEPLMTATPVDVQSWLNRYYDEVLKEDLRDVESVRDLSLVQLMVDELPSEVSSPLSVHRLAKRLEIAHATAKRWLGILERLFVIYRLPPYTASGIRSVKKEQKAYFWNWAKVENQEARFENMLASQLLKFCHWREDVFGERTELRYLRDTDQREVDFIVVSNDKPLFAVDARLKAGPISRDIRYFGDRIEIPDLFQVYMSGEDHNSSKGGVQSLSFSHFCRKLELP